MKARQQHRVPLLPEPPEGAESTTYPLVARDDSDRILVLGSHRPWFTDLYYQTLTVGWLRFLLSASAAYLGGNVLFASLYLLQPGAITNAQPGSFADAFFFSVQTMATIGYGYMAPATLYANIMVTIETLIGLILFAIATGLAFARFSRPRARVLFSRVAVIGPHQGRPTLSVRLANERRNQLLQAEVAMTLVRDEPTAEGGTMRRFYDLELVRNRTPIFAMSFSVLHVIDADSPLHGATAASLEEQNAELVVTGTGLDETMAQTVHARTSYLPKEILWDHRFVDIFGWTEDGQRAIDYRRFHDTTRVV
jgi:inward rectifier potassium channel